MFLTFINTNHEHLLHPKTLMDSQEWIEDKWEQPEGIGIALNQKLLAGDKIIIIVVVFVNKQLGDLAYWLSEPNGTPFFKTSQEVQEAIKNGKLKLL
jgi:hypothetical protein